MLKTEEDIDNEVEIESIGNESDAEVGKKLVFGLKNVISSGVQAMNVEPIVISKQKACAELGIHMPEDLKDGKRIARTEPIECGSTEHVDLIKVVDTHKQNAWVDNGAYLHLVDKLKSGECDMTKLKRCKVYAVRDFPKDFKNFEDVDQKSQEDYVRESGDHKSKEDHVKETNDDSDKHLKVDFRSQENLVDPFVDARSCEEEFEEQESVVPIDLEEVIQSDVDLELHEAFEDEETIGQFECGEHDNNSCGSPKRRKVYATRDFPDAFKILKSHKEASGKNQDHRVADKLAGNIEATCDSQYDVQCMNKNVMQDPMATLRCPSTTSKSYQSDIKSHQNKGKSKGKGKGVAPKRKQSEESAPINVVLALMAPTKCQRRPGQIYSRTKATAKNA
ncbi:PREDICTED: uncharacterized protein LOC109208502 isoform X2 [Nicotiana attenuata]|uniref:uncharacterized protein LOC109208502 isoform X2 n=1 Tax=Nicotiana attenuata TaxID=49451 RepID=UPI0009058B5E|nr:PREDICTED: uncharacterized protein LOC109208502 isoform X2 [Nicotiana attenuata]